jgi:hypothetical protein
MPSGIYIITTQARINVGKASSLRRGKLNHHWSGKYPTYIALHKWLHREYGKADKCENILCLKTSKNYAYALIKGKKLMRERNNFMKLCYSCHVKYDRWHKYHKGEIKFK